MTLGWGQRFQSCHVPKPVSTSNTLIEVHQFYLRLNINMQFEHGNFIYLVFTNISSSMNSYGRPAPGTSQLNNIIIRVLGTTQLCSQLTGRLNPLCQLDGAIGTTAPDSVQSSQDYDSMPSPSVANHSLDPPQTNIVPTPDT